MDKVICPLYIHYQGDEVVWVNLDLNNQLKAVCQWYQIVQEFLMRIRCWFLPNFVGLVCIGLGLVGRFGQ
jgi:hypothetical protein